MQTGEGYGWRKNERGQGKSTIVKEGGKEGKREKGEEREMLGENKMWKQRRDQERER